MIKLKKTWGAYTKEERFNNELMTATKGKLEADLENYDESSLYKNVVDQIAANTKALAKAKETSDNELAKITDKQAGDRAKLQAEIDEFLNKENAVEGFMQDHEYHYVQEQNSFAKFHGNRWTWLSSGSIKQAHLFLRDKETSAIFDQKLVDEGRCNLNSTYTFQDCDSDTLNLMRRDNWLERVVSDEYHPFFDVLFDSLSCGKDENKEHLEHVIAYKYAHPENFLIPCVNIFGEGNVGKGVLMTELLPVIFTTEQVLSTTKANVLGDFNSMIAGKTVVMVDEITTNKSDMAAFKALIGNKTFTVNPKGLTQFQADQTALFFTGSNDVLSSVRLAGDGSDRRWSILKVTAGKTLRWWLDKHGYEDYDIKDLIDVITDPEEVAKWLYCISVKHVKKGCPVALHGEDYQDLINNQKTELAELCETIFNDDRFVAITKKDFWSIYQMKMKYENPNWRGRDQRSTMVEVDSWLTKHKEEVELFDRKNFKEYEKAKTTIRRRNVYCFKMRNWNAPVLNDTWLNEDVKSQFME